MIDTQATLGDLVTDHPGIARALERHGLDYCCHGQRTLGDACTEAGLDADTVAADLAKSVTTDAPRPDWASMGPAELVDHLEAVHHAYLHEEMPRLSALLEKIASVHGDRHPELHDVRERYELLRADLDPHLMKEEQVLFPLIRALAAESDAPTFPGGSIGAPISVMMHEHDRAGELLEELRALTNGYEVPADGCGSYQAAYRGLEQFEADTHLHVHKENNVLFPMVLELEARPATA